MAAERLNYQSEPISQEGIFQKGLRKLEDFNKVTFGIGAGVATAGVIFGSAAALTFGAVSMAVDGGTIYLSRKIRNRNKK